MSRPLKPYGKKRGHRRTGSKKTGYWVEAAIFGAIFLAGCAMSVVLLRTMIWPEWRVNQEFVETGGTVTGKRLVEIRDKSGVAFRPEISIEYKVGAIPYHEATYDIAVYREESYTNDRAVAEAVLGQFEAGQEVTCWYDPDEPSVVVLQREFHWWIWLFALVPVAMLVIGGGGLVFALRHAGKSRERSAAAAGRSDRYERRDADGRESAGNGELFPHVPSDENITNSPGTTLAYRLPISTSPGWKLLGALLLCLFWSGVTSVFVVMVVRGHLAGRPNWWLTTFVAPLVLIALGTIYYFFRQLLFTRGVGPTRLEIGEHPIYPGQTYELLISQTGKLSVGSLEVLLACDEEATYQQGTDTRTDRQRVFYQQVFHREDFEILPEAPFEDRCRFEVPSGSMHSFKSENNEISWKLIVRGNVARWPAYERSFPIVVAPSRPPEGEA
ncbi:MAG: DUF3592 domain-containing protein [Planctomycetes bacterium]|nr:DUF3592 domain-containing protein [Planctomycetota bacterium]